MVLGFANISWNPALALENSNAILFYHSKTPLYQYTIPFYNTSASQNSIFIKILFFNHSLLFLPNRSASFSWAFQQPFLFLSPSTGSTHNTHPLYTDQPIQTHHHTHTHKHKHQTSNKATHKHNPATKPSHTHKHKPIQKPGHRSKTQARPPIHAADQPIHTADLKPRPPIKNRSKPIQKKIITGANPFKPIQKTSSPEPSEQTHSKKSSPKQTHSKNIITGATKQTHSIKSSPEPSEQIRSKK